MIQTITKLEMYDFLADNMGLGQDTMDVIVKVFGDTVETYKKVLAKISPYKTFAEAFDDYRTKD